MTAARAMVRPGKWGARDASWPKLNLSYFPPIAGAYHDWAIDQMPLGSAGSWPSLSSDLVLEYDGVPPVVTETAGKKSMVFDGENSRMRALTPGIPAAHTILAVYRFINFEAGDSVLYSYADGVGGTISSTVNTPVVSAQAGGYYLLGDKNADTNWHISILSSNDADSAFRTDNYEAKGRLGSAVRAGITLGFSQKAVAQGGNLRANIEYRRVAILPPLNAQERLSVYNTLREKYI